VIGTHDVGAIAFYSGRRIVDMVGLVSPEMIKNIGSFDRLIAFLGRERVTHLAVLRTWFEVANQKPTFQTDEAAPEIMEVFPFDPARCHFTPQNAGVLIADGSYLLSLGQVQRAGPMLVEAVRLDPRSARAHYGLGVAFLMVGKDGEAEREITRALELQPDSWQAMFARAQLYIMRNDPNRALEVYKEVELKDPTYAPVYQALSHFYLTVKKDTVAGQEYLAKFTGLAGEGGQESLR
jgi:predicted Zn-dependent protease